MKKWLLLACIIIVFALTSAYFYLQLEKENAQKHSEKTFNAAFDELKKSDYSKNKSEPRAMAMQKKAIEKIQELIEQQPSLDKKRKTAASTFMGFYLANLRTRSEYCSAKGIDISLFRNAFLNAHVDDLAAAKSLLFKKQEEIDSFYQLIAAQSRATVAQDMQDMSNLLNISPEESCQMLEANADNFSRKMKFSVVQPFAYKYLHKQEG